ncbi:MAG: RsmB/NOP family class I SAM-dependent RNA methyltransferase [Snodgrassella sp.]|uniref:SAM-dependent methyltransferase n=1 Tax=Snodgrassella alvi TaxID=1196083 RepID=A0A2N9XR64_9NEIS|nr:MULTISPECIES: RsmB/NOP family class I SAM-dependent RNA methyltransferase [Snodgrassella]MCO6508411.1 RsmB/NOP family class I SAM-dependent RNA methyltransferase [Snodgrassella sp.]MCO6512858.1 RsmB/NOP family class I SAM-dependent RNA methyltransferase [Snodgrassella sp.]MCO6516438.1 RsmB/NOP family class I SAM-dependent RNA methyltransferase [Snodgrassella sp.]MCO6518637.1 RsmB/NOP family class I SAM-dependent RNA methyltransferase [Snodgrassella sp.]MCO6519655.1 RsmB/NOP family class I S
MNAQQLDLTAAALAQVLTFRQPADVVLSAFFRRQRKLGVRDRQEIAETVFATIRHLQKIQKMLQRPHNKPRRAALAALVLGRGLSIHAVESLCDAEEKQWLVELKEHKSDFAATLATAAELPEWMTDCLQQQGWDENQIIAFGRSVMQAAPLDVRVNTLKGKRDKILAVLQAEGLRAEATPYSPWGIRLYDKPALNRHPLFLDGVLEVQDEGSQLLALLTGVKRGQIAVDFCAGAGGKTLAMGAMMAGCGRLYALDVAEKRLANLKPRMVRAGLTNIHPQRIDNEHDARIARLKGKADCVLVDAPCSGLGTLRRNPDLKYRQSGDNVEALQQQQRSILQAASALVRSGGRLIYATCSILEAENQQQLNDFLAANTGWHIEPVQTLLKSHALPAMQGDYLQLNTSEHHTDGFFAAVLTRIK